MLIKEVYAKKIPNSRREPTIEVSVNGCKASSPSGKSTGKYETPQYRISLSQSIKDISNLNLSGINISNFSDLSLIENEVKRKFRLHDVKKFGANALVALEIAILKALAKENKKQLWQVVNPKARKFPIPVGNAVGGGLHSHNRNSPEFQEFLLIPNKRSPRQNISLMNKVYGEIKKIIKAETKNDEGAWQTSLSNEQILSALKHFKNLRLGIDIAASSFYRTKYNYKNKSLDRIAQIKYINGLIEKYNLFYIEDPLQENDFRGFSKIKRSNKHLIVGDDLTATQISRVKKAIKLKSINAMIIKPNQNGSLIELQKIFSLCKKNKIKTILSHRSGETLEDSLSDLAFAFQADFIKCGISTKWREVKLKRLIEIEKSLSKL